MSHGKPILCLDFDGVIHSYQQPWQSARIIPDRPVEGALEFIVDALEHWTVAIHSSRSHHFGGRKAMQRWLIESYFYVAHRYEDAPYWWTQRVARSSFCDEWHFEAWWAAKLVVREIQWPLFKPPAKVTLDDRAITFTGKFPDLDELASFKPWNKRAKS